MKRNAPRDSGNVYPYEDVAADVLRRIRAGEWKVGERMPTIQQMVEQCGRSRTTVNKALQSLAAQGYLVLDRKKGIRLLQSRRATRIGLLMGEGILQQPTQPFPMLLVRAARDYFGARGIENRLYVERGELMPEGIPCPYLQEDLKNGLIDGLLTAQGGAPGCLRYSSLWRRCAVPLVHIGDYHSVDYRIATGVEVMLREAFRLFRERGCGGVAVLANRKIPTAEAFALAEEYGLHTRSEWLRAESVAPDVEAQGYQEAWMLFAPGTERPDALLVLDDVMAKGVVQALLALGVRVPQDLCLVHHFNRGSGIFYPLIGARLEYDPDEYISSAAGLLQELLVNPALPPRTQFIQPRLRLEDGTIRN